MNSDLITSVARDWWYYSVELQPGFVTKGICPPKLPMLPRMLMREVDLRGADCLDIGSMEGLIPAMMHRKGATRILATDAIPHCERKMAALKQAYEVDFEFHRVGLMYDMANKLKDAGGFDFVNFSGVGYHVFSPMHCLAGLRPLVKRGGLMTVATNVINRDGYTMEYNNRGALQVEANTFWYLSIPMLESMIRYFKLVPIDCLYYPHSAVNPATYVPGIDLGYMAVVCRAVDDDEIVDGDKWAAQSRRLSWEYQTLCDSARMNAQPRSHIAYANPRHLPPRPGGMDLLSSVQDPRHVVQEVDDLRNSHFLMLGDVS